MSDINNLLEIAEDDKQSSYRRRQAVTDLLKNHPADQQTLRVVEKLLSGNDTSLKRDVVGAVKDSPDPKILPILKPLLAVDDDYLRRDAVQAIGRLGSREEVELVREMTSDKSFTVSYAAKTALAEIEKRVAAQEVVVEEVLEEPEPEPEVEPEPEPEAEPESALEPEPEVVEEPEFIPEETLAEEIEEKDEADDDQEESSLEESVEEIKPHQQKLPQSLHDNSIFGKNSIEDVNKQVEEEIESEISQKSPISFKSSTLDSSLNLNCFFSDEAHLALSFYKQLANYSEELPVKEAAISEAKRQLTLLEADKADDVEASKESVKLEQKDVDDVKWKIKKANQDYENYEKEHESMFSTLLFMFSADKKDEVVAHKAKLKKELRELKEQLANEEAELLHHKTEKKSLLEPIVEMRKTLDQKIKDRDAILDKVIRAEKQINELITRLLLSSDSESLKSRLSFIASKDTSMAQLASEKIISLVSKIRTEELNNEKLQSDYDDSVKSSNSHLLLVGEEINKSLIQKESSVKKEVSVSVSVNFKEEESFFSFSNASGTASGEGSALGTMKVQELEWRESPNLENSIGNFSNGFNELGHKAAARELGLISQQSSEAVLNSYIDYLRSLIEADFGA